MSKKVYFLILIIFTLSILFMAGCGGESVDDKDKTGNLRILKATDKITFLNPNVDQELFGTIYNYTVIPVDIETSKGKNIISEIPLNIEVVTPLSTSKKIPVEYDYYNYVQYSDGSIAEVAGNLSADGKTLDLTYENLMCQGTLYNGLTWLCEGYTYKVVSYEYTNTNVKVFGSFQIQCTGNGMRKISWWCPEIGFYIKEVSDLDEQILYTLELKDK